MRRDTIAIMSVLEVMSLRDPLGTSLISVVNIIEIGKIPKVSLKKKLEVMLLNL